MWTKIKVTVLSLCLIVIIGILGCRSLVDSLTPAQIDSRSQEYGEVSDDQIGEWSSLNDAIDVRKEIIIKHRTVQTDLMRQAQDDKINYKDAIGFIDGNLQEAYDLQSLVIGSPENPYSILGMLAPFGIGAVAGSVLIKRRQDFTPEQVEVAIAKEKVKAE